MGSVTLTVHPDRISKSRWTRFYYRDQDTINLVPTPRQESLYAHFDLGNINSQCWFPHLGPVCLSCPVVSSSSLVWTASTHKPLGSGRQEGTAILWPSFRVFHKDTTIRKTARVLMHHEQNFVAGDINGSQPLSVSNSAAIPGKKRPIPHQCRQANLPPTNLTPALSRKPYDTDDAAHP